MRPLMPPVQTPDNLFHDGNPLTGELGTIVDAEHLNNEQAAIRDTQSELIAILTAAAMQPESTAGQLLVALNKLYAPLNDTLGALSTLVGGANKLPYFTASNAAALTALSSIGRDIIGKATVADVLTYLGLKEAAPGVSVVGDSRNARMSITSASATASFTSDMLIVAESLSGKQYRLTSVSKTINLATTGAGGMDTGTAPVSGFVGLYVIYNPTTGDTAMLAVNATSAAVPEIYGGANLPAGYTASALVAVIGTTASALFVIGQLVGRTFSIVNGSAMSTSTSVTGWTSASLATFVPRNGKTVRGTFSVSAQAGQNAIVTGVAATSTGVGAVYAGSIVSSLLQYVMDLATPQTAFYWGQVSGGSISALLTVCAYTI
ncbi:TPA: hypothetical protein VCC33_003013 [Kluyvera cryocrescens]|nr:hypothetical protein [Kluyvera cryocrescens]